MKKLLIIGAVCIAGLSSCKPSFCPAYSKKQTVNNQRQMVKADSEADSNRI